MPATIRFELCIQRYVDAASTPIEDTAIEWTESASPPVKVAELVISEAGRRHRRGVHQRAGDRRACLQSMEHDRRVPPARQSEPCPQGCLRRKRRPPPRLSLPRAKCRCATACLAAWRARPSRSSIGASNGTGCRCGSACSTSMRSAMCCRLQNLIDTEIGEAPPQGAAGAARRRSPKTCAWRAAMTAPSTISPYAKDGLRRLDLRPQSEARLRARSVRHAQPGDGRRSSCSTATRSIRRAR